LRTIRLYQQKTYHPFLSDSPHQRESVRTLSSISLRQSIPSDMTRFHSWETSSAAHNDLASRYDKICSAMWSNPRAVKQTQHLYDRCTGFHSNTQMRVKPNPRAVKHIQHTCLWQIQTTFAVEQNDTVDISDMQIFKILNGIHIDPKLFQLFKYLLKHNTGCFIKKHPLLFLAIIHSIIGQFAQNLQQMFAKECRFYWSWTLWNI